MEQARRLVSYSDHKPRFVDIRTLLLVLVMMGLTVMNVAGLHLGYIHWLPGLLLATYLMNLSFTAWHEPAHGNFSSHRRINDVVGVLSSFASVYPGYFARKREHLIHHKYEGDSQMDPVYARIQSKGILFPYQLIKINFLESRTDPTLHEMPLSPWQKNSDTISNLSVLLVLALSFYFGFSMSILLGWIIPRIIVFLVHAVYVCYLPHSVAGGGYQVYRIHRGWFAWLLTIGQNLHGIHHRWPFVPWYAYRRVAQNSDEALKEQGIQVVGLPVLKWNQSPVTA